MYEVRIIGTGSFLPQQIIKNDSLSDLVDTNDEWISTRTGIKERRISSGENTSDLAIEAAKEAIKDAGINAEEIDLIVLATSTPDFIMPSTACLVQKGIKAYNATCFDITAACTGFIYALNIGYQFIRTGQSKTALIIGADTNSKIIDWSDRNTCVLFGDGAGAAILQRTDKEGIIFVDTGSDGRGDELLFCPGVHLKNPFMEEQEEKKQVMHMNGKEVFRFSTTVVPQTIEKLLQYSSYHIEDIKYFLLHQANARIMEAVAKKMNIDPEKFYKNIHKYGNTSAATIPIALNEMDKAGLLEKDDLLVLVGFGGGLTWGSALVKWNK